MKNVGGLFVVLLAGLGVASLTAIVEYCWTKKKIKYEKQVLEDL